MGQNIIDNAIVDPATWEDENAIHRIFTELRAAEPLRYMRPYGFEPFWSVTKHAHIKEIERNHDVFRSAPRSTLTSKQVSQMIRLTTGRKHLVSSLVQMDAPDHQRFRKITQTWFTRENMHKIQHTVQRIARECVEDLIEKNGECDFAKEIATIYPLRVIMELIGIPRTEERKILALTQSLFANSDPDLRHATGSNGDCFEQIYYFEQYFADLATSRRISPKNDLATTIANAEIDGAFLEQHHLTGYFIVLVTAGHDSTSATLSGGLLSLIQNPSQFDKLLGSIDTMLSSASNEMTRWVSPVRHFVRTAAEDYPIGDIIIKRGESAVLWYPSGNRDEEVYDEPFEFRIERTESNLGFGHGVHGCLGQQLARIELDTFFSILFDRISDLSLNGQPKFIRSNFLGGLKSLPIRYSIK